VAEQTTLLVCSSVSLTSEQNMRHKALFKVPWEAGTAGDGEQPRACRQSEVDYLVNYKGAVTPHKTHYHASSCLRKLASTWSSTRGRAACWRSTP
jgi:hypothetical protein